MAMYEPSVGLVWKYDQTDRNLKIVATIYVEVDADKENIVINSKVPGEWVAIIEGSVTTNLPHATTSVVKKQEEIIIDDIGQGNTLTQVKVKVLENSPYEVIVSVSKAGEASTETSTIASEKTKLEYT
jgi:hypothetical protein